MVRFLGGLQLLALGLDSPRLLIQPTPLANNHARGEVPRVWVRQLCFLDVDGDLVTSLLGVELDPYCLIRSRIT